MHKGGVESPMVGGWNIYIYKLYLQGVREIDTHINGFTGQLIGRKEIYALKPYCSFSQSGICLYWPSLHFLLAFITLQLSLLLESLLLGNLFTMKTLF